MKRRIFAFVLCLSMLLSLVAFPVHAETVDGPGSACTCEGLSVNSDGTYIHESGCPLYEAPQCTCGENLITNPNGTVTHVPGCPEYVAPVSPACTCGDELTSDDHHLPGCPLNTNVEQTEETDPAADAETQSPEDDLPMADAPVLGLPAASDPFCTCQTQDGTHSKSCPRYDGVSLYRDAGAENISLEPGETVHLIFEDYKPAAVLGSWNWKPAQYDKGVVKFTVPEDAKPGTTYEFRIVRKAGDFISDFTRENIEAKWDLLPIVAVVTVEGTAYTEDYQESNAVAVSGSLPEGAKLVVEEVTAADVADTITDETQKAIIEGLDNSTQDYKAYDISLMNPKTRSMDLQPDGTVNVTIRNAVDAGHYFYVYHVHDGNVEKTGPYIADGNGNANFELPSFSHVIVVDGNAIINDIEYYFPASGDSTNGHFKAIGVYFTTSGNAHILLGGNDDKASKIDVQSVSLGTAAVEGASSKVFGKVANLNLNRDDGTTESIYISTHNYLVDIDLGPADLTEKFNLSVSWKTAHGFDIEGMPIVVTLEYSIDKSVASVGGVDVSTIAEPVPVNRGQEVVYKIVASNSTDSNINIADAIISDTLPANLFDLTKGVQYQAEGDPAWTTATLDPAGKFVIASGVELAPGASFTYYVKATVKSDATKALYTNTASIGGEKLVEKKDTAVVEINTDPVGHLRVSKTVPSITDVTIPIADFTFSSNLPVGTKYQVYDAQDQKVGNEQTLTDARTFMLKAGQYALFNDLPSGEEYTITEINMPEYFKIADGKEVAQSVTIVSSATETVEFVNTYIVPGSLTFTKVVETNRPDDETMVAPDKIFHFTFTLNPDPNNLPAVNKEYDYEITGEGLNQPATGKLSSGGKFDLKAGWSIQISDLPAGAEYTITEDALTGEEYKGFSCADSDVSGTITANPTARAMITNLYSLYDLVIRKTVSGTVEENQSFVFKVTGPDGYSQEVVIHGQDSATIKYLYAGEYTVTEETGWSWRYTGGGSQTVELGTNPVDTYTGFADFTNTHALDKWLSGSNWRVNRWINGSSPEGTRHDGN